MKRTQGERIIYPVGEEFDVEKVVKDTRSEYERINITFINHHCEKMLTERKIYKIKIWKRNNTYFPDGRISKRSKKKCEKR